MIKRFFTSDTHFDDDRFDLFYRPFKTVMEQRKVLIENWNNIVGPDDIVYHVGDFGVTDESLDFVQQLNGEIHLIRGNYDDPRDHEVLWKSFSSVQDELEVTLSNGKTVLLNHYPERASTEKFNIVGHIHGLWKIQRNMINVSTDAWHFRPVSEDEIVFAMNAIEKFYDSNVFAGELPCNLDNSAIREVYAEEKVKTEDFKVFLAGPTPRDKHTRSWRPMMVNALKSSGFKGTVCIPEKRSKIEDYDYVNQVEWEEWALNEADIIIFWVPRELKKMPAFTTNVEFGEWMTSGKCILGYPEDAQKMRYMRYKAEQHNIPTYNTMEGVAKEVLKNITK